MYGGPNGGNEKFPYRSRGNKKWKEPINFLKKAKKKKQSNR